MGSCITKHLKSHFGKSVKELVLWSDSCERWSTSGNVRKLISLHRTDSLRCAYNNQDENAPVLRMKSLSAHKPEPPATAFYTVTIQSDNDMKLMLKLMILCVQMSLFDFCIIMQFCVTKSVLSKIIIIVNKFTK